MRRTGRPALSATRQQVLEDERAKVHDVSPHDLRHRFGYGMTASVPLHRLAQLMGHDSLYTTLLYVRGTRQDLQQEVEKIAWT